jgi:hypothetical protein
MRQQDLALFVKNLLGFVIFCFCMYIFIFNVSRETSSWEIGDGIRFFGYW